MSMNETSAAWEARWRDAVRLEDDLVRFVREIGFCTINQLVRWPAFPSQEIAMGLSDVLGATWFWKDDLHTQKRVYYTRLFAGRPGFVSPALLPTFIATNGEVADELIHFGRLPATTQEILRHIEAHGPISTRKLKALLGPDARRAGTTALIDLEQRFIITKTGITGREMGTYGYLWDLAERWVPEAFTASDRLKRKEARAEVIDRLRAVGVDPQPEFLTRVLRWRDEQ